MKRRAPRNALIAAGLIMVVWFVVAALLSRANCAWYGSQTERSTRYAAFVGCMVQVEDHWVPRAELRTEQ